MLDKINQSSFIDTKLELVNDQSTNQQPDQNDIRNFNDAMSQPQHLNSSNSGPLSHLAGLEADAMSKLQNLSTSLNPGDYMKTARSLSAYQLETMVATKVIAKSTQAIEKLTNLQ